MEITQCYLDEHNARLIDGVSIGERVKGQGKKHLWDERTGQTVDTVVVHYISAADSNPERPYDLDWVLRLFGDFGVSSHYLVERSGNVMALVPEDKKAWHCGGSIMPEPDNRQGVNDFSIGIELVAREDSGFTDAQYDSLIALCEDICGRYTMTMKCVGHDDVAGPRAFAMGLRQDVKTDPGPYFDWNRLGRWAFH